MKNISLSISMWGPLLWLYTETGIVYSSEYSLMYFIDILQAHFRKNELTKIE